MPVVHPAEVWKESGRYYKIGPELVRFKDRAERDMVLAMTHEEVVAILLRDIVQSYRQLPMMVYHFQTKFRDEPRSRGGLIRVREFVMKDAYSCDRDDAGLDESYRRQYEAYERIFERLGLDAIAVGADVGIMGGTGAHEFMVLNDVRRGHPRPVRQLRLRRQPADRRSSASPIRSRRTPCRWRTSRRPARRRSTRSRRSSASREPDGQGRVLRDRRRPLRRRDRPRRLRRQRDEARQRGQGDRRAPAGHGRGDQGPRAWRPATARRSARRDAVVVVDELVARSPNLVAGANRVGWHVKNVNVPRDYTPDLVAEITERPRGRSVPRVRVAGEAPQGDRGRQHLQARDRLHRRVRRRRTSARTASAHPIVMGSYGIGARAERRLRRRGPPRREGHRLAGRGRAVRRPPRDDRGGEGAARRPRSPSGSTTLAQDAGSGATSCTTTATSRPA